MGKRILYIEDDFNNRTLVSRILMAYDYEVFQAEDGMAGIRMAQEVQPDLILMDINMPNLDGYEAATKIKSLPGLSRTPVIAVTANVMMGDRERALTAGCDGYLPKPIDVDALPEQIEQFIGGRREKVAEDAEISYLREYNERLVGRLEEKIQALTVANEQLKRSDEMKSRFIAVAAHELRTPITVIRGYVDILLSKGMASQFDAGIRPMLEGIGSGVLRLYDIVQDMLDMTHLEAGTLKLQIAPVRVSEVVEKIIPQFQEALTRRNLTITREMSDVPNIWGDGGRVRQILNNLIGNAIKYTPNGGSIKITARAVGEEIRVAAPGRLKGDKFVEVVIADTGVGIDPQEIERIFERFYEVRDPSLHSTSKTEFMGGGAGLGLSIARGMAEAHGGWIWGESEAHDMQRCPGSKFHLVLPIGEPPAR
jgi:signal transduction histidine kinase